MGTPIMPPPIPTQVGKYQILRTLGTGGTGVVYLAEDPILGRQIALKVMQAEHAKRSSSLDRFLLEARSAGRLNHPHTVAVFEVDVDRSPDGETRPYIAMEWMAGGTAEEAIQSRGPLPWREAARWVADACRGLQAAHEAGLLHRDIKPSNLLRTSQGIGKLGDFGLVKPLHTESPILTVEGSLIGTPAYMSPEQCQGEPLDIRSDIYSLGATFYALLAGRPPFDAPTHFGIMFAHCSSPPPDPRAIATNLPVECSQIIVRAMAKSPADRFSSAADFLDDIERLISQADSAFDTIVVFPAEPPTVDIIPDPTSIVARPSKSSKRKALGWIGLMTALLLTVGASLWMLTPAPKPTSLNEPIVPSVVNQQSTAVASPSVGPKVPLQPIDLSKRFAIPPMVLIGKHDREILDMKLAAGNKTDRPFGSLVACSSAGSAGWWKLESSGRDPKHVARFKENDPTQPELFAVAWFPDRKRLITGGSGPDLLVWNMEQGTVVSRTPQPHVVVLSMVAAPDGKSIVTGGHVGVHRWELGDDDKLVSRGVLRNDMLMVKTVAFSSEQSVLAAGGQHGTHGIVSTWSGLLFISATDFGRRRDFHCSTIAFSPNRAELVMGDEAGEIRHGVYSNRVKLQGDKQSPLKNIRSADFHPTRRLVAFAGTESDLLCFYRLDVGKIIPVPIGKGKLITVVRFAPDGEQIIVGTMGGEIWKIEVPSYLWPPVTPANEIVLDRLAAWVPNSADIRQLRRHIDAVPALLRGSKEQADASP